MRGVKFLIFCTGLMIIFVGCQKEQDPNQNNHSKPPNESEKNVNHETETYELVYPLTGIATNDSVDHRIISVMINNHPDARPQTGLQQADIVFEILAEGSTTRFLALFHSEQPDIVGPVRSAREYFFELAKGYDALYVYHGAADFINDMITNRGIDHLNGSLYDNDGHLFTRESFRKAPHNSYVHLPVSYDIAEEKGYETTTEIDDLKFLAESDEITGDKANHVKIGYQGDEPRHIVEYVYNEQYQTYQRCEDGEETKDLASDEQIEVNNLLVVEAPHQVIDDDGRRAIDLATNGKALLIQQGKQQQVEWKNENGQIVPVKSGEILGLVPGKTWINVVPSIHENVEIIE